MIQIEWFIYGFAAGWLAQPLWHIGTRIVQEARIAQQEWTKKSENH
jgi:hypothetical protein